MGVGNKSHDNRDNKILSMDQQQPIASKNLFEPSETAENLSTSQSLLLSQSSIDTRATASVSCNNSPLHVNENEGFQITVIAKDDSDTTTATLISSTTGDQQSKVQIARRERRPDRAVYVPRARRSQTTPPTTAATAATATTMTTNTATIATNTTTSSSNHHKSSSIILAENTSEAVSSTSLVRTDESTKKKVKTSSSNTLTLAVNSSAGKNGIVDCKERRVDRHRKSFDKSKSNTQIDVTKESNCNMPNKQQVCDRQQGKQKANQFVCEQEALVPNHNHASTKEKRIVAAEMNTTKNNSLKKVPSLSASVENGVDDSLFEKKIALPVPKVSHMLIEEVSSNEQANLSRHAVNPTKCDIDEQELQRASKEINRSNRRIMKQTFVSDVLEIPDKIEHTPNVSTYISNAKAKPPPYTNFDSTTEDEEDDWESKYNESGECLDPRMLEELESALGKVKITTPKADYSAFLTNQALLNDEEFPHVLEVSNFPVEFKNQDLLMVFSQYKESGFDIKWVDDTHALAVFSSSRVAAEVLTSGHPFVVLKPLAEATLESRLKAKKCAGSLQPYRQRPETCAALARRLVTGALGVRLETAAAERENEKRVLRKAKERKLLAAKQRDEAWES